MQKLLLVVVFVCGLLIGSSFATWPSSCANLKNLLYRTYDGTCNTLLNPNNGKANNFYSRGPEGAEFADGVQTPVTYRPAERVISNAICRADPSATDPIPHSLFATQFGQLVNHDLQNNRFQDLASPTIFLDLLAVPEKNDDFCQVYANAFGNPPDFTLINKCLPPYNEVPVIKNKFSLGQVVNGRFEIYNNATSWLDLSQVYGPREDWNSLLRTFSGGRLLTQDYINQTVVPALSFGFFDYTPYPPITYNLYNAPPSLAVTGAPIDGVLTVASGVDPKRVFTSGDERIGENAALGMFTTIFIRNHNYWADRLAREFPFADDELLFQEARRRNIAEYQSIVLYEYLPTEFGSYFADYVGPYRGYEPYLQVDTPIVFSTGAFRYGHSSFRSYSPRDACGNATMFNLPAVPGAEVLYFGGETGGPIDPIDTMGEAGSYENLIRGLISTGTQPNDPQIDDALRNIPGRLVAVGGADILAMDLNRGRLNGLPNWNTVRKAYYPNRHEANIYGLPGCPAALEFQASTNDPIACFNYVSPSNASLAQSLLNLYGKVNKIDAFMGFMAEGHVPGTSIGLTTGTIIADEYNRIRNADRFWFENRAQVHPFSPLEILTIRNTVMRDLLARNFDLPLQSLPENVFLTASFSC